MSTYKGRYYKVELPKAGTAYKCAISGIDIPKGEHYLCLAVEDTISIERRKMYTPPLGYIPTQTLRISAQVLGDLTMEQILDATGLFETDSEKVRALQKENKLLHEALKECSTTRVAIENELALKQLTELHRRQLDAEESKSTNVRHCTNSLRNLINDQLIVGTARYCHEMNRIDRTFTADTIARAKKALGLVTVDLRSFLRED